MTTNSSLLFLLLSILLFSACENMQNKNNTKFSSMPEGVRFIEPSYMDTTINPADDFYMYANGGWFAKNEIPASESEWGSFDLLEDFNKKVLKELLESAANTKKAPKGSPEQMVGDMYACGMDTATIETLGAKPLQGILAEINNCKTTNDLVELLARNSVKGLNPLWSFYIGPDDMEVTKNICNFYQSGLGLPDRDYYLKDDKKEIKEKYIAHVSNVFLLSGLEKMNADINAKKVLQIETALAQASMDRVSMRDPYKMYNKYDLNTFSKNTLGLDWKKLLSIMNIQKEDTVLVAQPNYFKALALMLQKVPLDDWKVYLQWHTYREMSPYLSSNFEKENFEFYGKVLRGLQEQKPRWKKMLSLVDGAVGEQLGKMYTEKYFSPEAKTRMMELVNNLQTAFEERINTLDWMNDSTKIKAKEKLHTFIKKIGYPDKWRDYTGLEIVRNDLVKNVLASNEFDFAYQRNKLGKPVDRGEWMMTPPTVNAYYNPAFNEIVFPAGILQYPFFDLSVDDAALYGGIGAVIGHEMTHGFDDQGCQYAADGNLKNWWSKEDKARFDAKTTMVKQQYDAYTILNGKHVNGSLTLGENIADLGGVTIAYDAFKKTKQAQENKTIDGFTPDQRFFLSWAQVWRRKIRDESASERLLTDPHSPAEHRCNGPLTNFAPFYKAFNISESNKMYKPEAQRAKVW